MKLTERGYVNHSYFFHAAVFQIWSNYLDLCQHIAIVIIPLRVMWIAFTWKYKHFLQSSYRNAEKWMKNLATYAPDDICTALVGNKVDLTDMKQVPQEVTR